MKLDALPIILQVAKQNIIFVTGIFNIKHLHGGILFPRTYFGTSLSSKAASFQESIT